MGGPAGTQYAISATFYCQPPRWTRCTRGYPAGSLVAAISPDLASWRGHRVRVCASRCVVVRIVDCNCAAEHSIDLYGAAFRAIAPLSRGRISVTVTLL